MAPPEMMSAVQIASMSKLGNVTDRHQQRGILRVLRDHFGKRCFETEYKVQMLCEGHSLTHADHIIHAYDEGKKKEQIDFLKTNIADEAAT